MQNEPILIKKYDNRRLYNVPEKKYISLDDVREMVVKGLDIKVIENRSGNDITRHVLLQVLMDMSPEKLEAFPVVYLRFLIQSPAALLKDYFSNFFEQQMSLFLGSREQYLSYLNDTTRQMMGGMTNPFFSNPFLQMMKGNPFFNAASQKPQQSPPENQPEDQPANGQGEPESDESDGKGNDELGEMKRMLAFMAKKIEDLEKKPK